MKQISYVSPRIQLKAYSTMEIAKFYEVSERTLKRWLSSYENEIGQKIGYFYTPKQVRIIFEKLGMPGVIQFS